MQSKRPKYVKGYIATKNCSNGYKESLIESYDILMRSINTQWNKPFYKRYDQLLKIPTTEQLNMLISHATTRMALILSILTELGTRPIELTWLKKTIKWKDKTDRCCSEKNSPPLR